MQPGRARRAHPAVPSDHPDGWSDQDTPGGSNFAFPFPFPLLAPACSWSQGETHQGMKGWGGKGIHFSPHFFSSVAQFPEGIRGAKHAGSSEAQQKTAMATKPAKWSESHEGNARLGWGRIRLILKEKSIALKSFSYPQTSIHEKLLK